MAALAASRSPPTALIHIGGAPLDPQPFPHIAIQSCLDEDLADGLLAWFESDAPWKLARQDFYEQYEFALAGQSHPSAARLTDDYALHAACAAMATLFGTRFSALPRIVAHKLVAGQRIDIHNDCRPGGETHRLLIQLNRGLVDDNGGYLMLFGSSQASDVAKILRPQHCSAVAFAISDRSYHAVSKIHGSERYTLVYSFYADAR